MKPPTGSECAYHASKAKKIISNTRIVRLLTHRISPLARLRFAAIALVAVFFLVTSGINSMFSRGSAVTAFAESIDTFSSLDCTTPKDSWSLGQTACAVATGATGTRRIGWFAPDGTIVDISGTFTSTGTDTYAIPLTAQVGTWIVRSINVDGDATATATFVVSDPDQAKANLSIIKSGPLRIPSDSDIVYKVTVFNLGPDPAPNVQVTDATPANTTFVSATQDPGPGPTFTCTGGDCSTGPTGLLAVNESVSFTYVYHVTAGTPNDTVISNTAIVSMAVSEPPTEETNPADNSSTAEAIVTSPVANPCTINCPADINLDNNPNDPNPCVAVATYTDPILSGNCADPDTGQTPAVVCSPPSGSTLPLGTTTVTCSGGTATCSFTVTLNETRAATTPTIACPGDITVSEEFSGAESATVTYTPTVTGNCVEVACTPPSGSRFNLGTTPVTCSGTDSSNTSTALCTFNVTVNASPCGLACADDQTVNESSPGSGTANVTYSTATAVGTCPALTITCTPASGSSFPVGLTVVNCTGRDGSNNLVAGCSFTVRVNSSSTCAITCPASPVTASENPPNSGSATVNYPAPTTAGNCSTLTCNPGPSGSFCCNPPSGSSFGVGTTTVNCSATDPAGNTSSCSFTVVVTGGTPCVITCPVNISQSGSGCGNVVTYSTPTTTGSCGGDPNEPPFPPIPTCNPPSGSFFPVGTTTVICSTDVGTQCSFTVTITGTDTIKPVISFCAVPSFAPADSCQAVVPNVTSQVEASDNCTPENLLIVTQSPLPGTLVGTGTTTITLTVTDASLNFITCMTTFTVTESIPPTAVCQPYTAVLDATGNASITAANVDNGSSDNCGVIASRTVTPNTFTCANKGPNTVTLTVTDPSGNSASCLATVTVVDNTPPTITCPASFTQSTDLNLCSAVVSFSATASDNCPGVTYSCTPPSGSTFPKGPTTVNCTATDAGGLTSSACSFTVTVNDTQLPAIACPANIVVEPTCPDGAVVTYTAPVGTDNCPGALTIQTAGLASGSTFPIGVTTTNTFKVTDTSGNFVTCSFTVRVKTAAEVIQDLITRVLALPLTGQQSQGLVSKLQAALDAVNTGKTNVACNKLADFISQVTGFINNGTLTSAQGQPLIVSAAKVRNTLGCTNLGCT